MTKDTIGSFSFALDAIKDGNKMCRRGWPNWQYIKIERPDGDDHMTCSYIFTNPEEGLLIPWTPSQVDLMSEEWEMFESAGDV